MKNKDTQLLEEAYGQIIKEGLMADSAKKLLQPVINKFVKVLNSKAPSVVKYLQTANTPEELTKLIKQKAVTGPQIDLKAEGQFDALHGLKEKIEQITDKLYDIDPEEHIGKASIVFWLLGILTMQFNEMGAAIGMFALAATFTAIKATNRFF